jgi:hypothetical protein
MQLFHIWSMMARQWLDMMDEVMSQPLSPLGYYQPTYPDIARWDS